MAEESPSSQIDTDLKFITDPTQGDPEPFVTFRVRRAQRVKQYLFKHPRKCLEASVVGHLLTIVKA